MAYLSKIELYYSHPSNFSDDEVTIENDEAHHIINVMRHVKGDNIFVTDGNGKIVDSVLIEANDLSLKLKIVKNFSYENKFKNIYFCLAQLKNQERLEFAFEKAVELGVTNFIIFNSDRAIHKNIRIERLNKISLVAMKQSVRSFLPIIEIAPDLKNIYERDGDKILFDQYSPKTFKDKAINKEEKYYFFFGPEGGFSKTEEKLFTENDTYSLAKNRLRSETASIAAAVILHHLFY